MRVPHSPRSTPAKRTPAPTPKSRVLGTCTRIKGLPTERLLRRDAMAFYALYREGDAS